MRDFRKLDIWRLGVEFAVTIYEATEKFPSTEIYGLTSQMRRSAVSISANIAEGSGRDSDGDFLRFLRIALGSLNEVETMIEISRRLGLLSGQIANVIDDQARDLGVRTRNLAARIELDLSQAAKPAQRNR